MIWLSRKKQNKREEKVEKNVIAMKMDIFIARTDMET